MLINVLIGSIIFVIGVVDIFGGCVTLAMTPPFPVVKKGFNVTIINKRKRELLSMTTPGKKSPKLSIMRANLQVKNNTTTLLF